MILKEKLSEAARIGEIYNLDHFDLAWSNEKLRRLMGNELVYPPSPKVIQAIQGILEKCNYYPEDALTDRELRHKLASYLDLEDKGDWIAVGNGSMQVIDMLFMTFINPGDEVLVPSPDYSPYARRAPLYGAQVVDILPDEAFRYSFERIVERKTQQTKMIYTSSPNNPTGQSFSRELVSALCATDCIVVIDEAYAEFSETTVCDLVLKFPNLIVSRTFSKAMGLAGIRLGFLFANPELIGYINRVRTPLNISLFAHVAAIAAIDDREYIQNNVRQVIGDREYLFKELTKIPGFKVFPSTGNFILINCKDTGRKATDFSDWLLEAGYIVRSFVNTRGLPGNEYFRITIGNHADTLGILAEIQKFIAFQ